MNTKRASRRKTKKRKRTSELDKVVPKKSYVDPHTSVELDIIDEEKEEEVMPPTDYSGTEKEMPLIVIARNYVWHRIRGVLISQKLPPKNDDIKIHLIVTK